MITIAQALEILIKIQNLEDTTKQENEQLEQFWAERERLERTSYVTSEDMSAECTMCGKPMSYRFCGMCVHCEQVWNG